MKLFSRQREVNQVLLLDIASIEANPYQPRRQFEPRALKELAQSISENGLLQPVTVRQTGEQSFQLISGERRLMACRILEMERIPAIIEEVDDEKSAIFALIENLQRSDLNYFEQAEGMQRLIECAGLTQEQLARKLGKAQPTIANKLRLLGFSRELRMKMIDGGLTERHARALLRLPDEQSVEEAIQCVVENRMNVGDTEKYVESILNPIRTIESSDGMKDKQCAKTRVFVIKDMRIFMNTISRAVSTMKLAGIHVDTVQEENDEFISYIMKIPKKSIYRHQTNA